MVNITIFSVSSPTQGATSGNNDWQGDDWKWSSEQQSRSSPYNSPTTEEPPSPKHSSSSKSRPSRKENNKKTPDGDNLLIDFGNSGEYSQKKAAEKESPTDWDNNWDDQSWDPLEKKSSNKGGYQRIGSKKD